MRRHRRAQARIPPAPRPSAEARKVAADRRHRGERPRGTPGAWTRPGRARARPASPLAAAVAPRRSPAARARARTRTAPRTTYGRQDGSVAQGAPLVGTARFCRDRTPSAPRASAAAPVAAVVPARTVFAGARRQPWTRATSFAASLPSRLRRATLVGGRAVACPSLGRRSSLRLVRCSEEAWDLALRAESGRAAGPPREESGVEKAFLKSARPSACAECADAFFPGGRSLEGSVDGARVPRRKVAAPPRTSSRRSDVSTCGGGLTGRTTGAGRRGAARGFQERPGSGGGPGSATGASASRTFAALSAGSSPLTSSSARRRRSNSSATWVSGPRVA